MALQEIIADNEIVPLNLAAMKKRSGKKTPPDKLAECRHLRAIDRLSLGEIVQRTGLPRGTVYELIKDLPLTKEERQTRNDVAAVKGRAKLSKIAASRRGPKSPLYDVMQLRAVTSNQRGAIAEAAAILRMKIWGLVPHLPLCPGGKSDLIVEVPDSGRIYRTQVKLASYRKHGAAVVRLYWLKRRKIRTRYDDAAFDFLIGYDAREDVCYVYHVSELSRNKSVKSLTKPDAERWDKLIS